MAIGKRWQCSKCGCWWPTYTTVSAYHNYKIANKIHPGEECEKGD